MLYTCEELYDKHFEKVINIHEIFKDFFGEERVDFWRMPEKDDATFGMLLSFIGKAPENNTVELDDWGYSRITDNCMLPEYLSIVVHWPEVTVTNEQGESIKIWDLYAKIDIRDNGILCSSPTFNRSRYDDTQFQSGYMHSHISDIDYDCLSRFREMCLGSSPIRNTIDSLETCFDSTLWMLFCEELNRLVSVESLEGIPYRHLSHVHRKANLDNIGSSLGYISLSKALSDFNKPDMLDYMKEFTLYYVEHGSYIISYVDGMFTINDNPKAFILDISNHFIDFYNNKVMNNVPVNKEDVLSLTCNAVIEKDSLKIVRSTSTTNVVAHNNKFLFTFKGNPVHLRIDIHTERDKFLLVLAPVIAYTVTNQILNIINHKYGEVSRYSKDACYI